MVCGMACTLSPIGLTRANQLFSKLLYFWTNLISSCNLLIMCSFLLLLDILICQIIKCIHFILLKNIL